MKVFLSWSGEWSKAAATTLHEWLPTVIQTVRPYMSAENIDKGERWSLDVSKQLAETHFGVICMAPDNLESPWVLFEAGALSKSIDKGRVSPLLFGLGPSDLTNSPLLQFQATVFKKDDFGKLLHSMNAAAPEAERLSQDVLVKSFNRAWNELETEVSKFEFVDTKRLSKIKHERPLDERTQQVLDELLNIVRSQMKLLRSPEELLPQQYLKKALSVKYAKRILPLPELSDEWDQIYNMINNMRDQIHSAEFIRGDIHEFSRNVFNLDKAIRMLKAKLYNTNEFRVVLSRGPKTGVQWEILPDKTVTLDDVKRALIADDVEGEEN